MRLIVGDLYRVGSTVGYLSQVHAPISHTVYAGSQEIPYIVHRDCVLITHDGFEKTVREDLLEEHYPQDSDRWQEYLASR